MTNRRPSIFQIGKVIDDGAVVRITGWGLGLCPPRCGCHCDPRNGGLEISQSDTGQLGLRQFLTTGEVCDCCEPWTANELAGTLRDLEALETLTTSAPEREEQS